VRAQFARKRLCVRARNVSAQRESARRTGDRQVHTRVCDFVCECPVRACRAPANRAHARRTSSALEPRLIDAEALDARLLAECTHV